MSLATYTSALPSIFQAQEETTPGNYATKNTEAPKPKDRVGKISRIPGNFADITEVKTQNLRGEGSEVYLTERCLPLPRTTEKVIKKFQQYSVLLRRTVVQTRQGLQPAGNSLEIQSESLQKIFRELVPDVYDNVDLEGSVIKIPDPYCELFFFRSEIEDYVHDTSKDPKLRKEIEILHEFITNEKQNLSPVIKDHENLVAQGKITANRLWTIYCPNQRVVFTAGPITECWICRNILYKSTRNRAYIEFTGARIDYDGHRTGIVKTTYKMDIFAGTRNISELPLVPVQFVKSWPETKARLKERGNFYLHLLEQQSTHLAYKGSVWQYGTHDMDDDTEYRPKFELDERVVVDYSMYLDEYTYFRPELQKQPRKKKKARDKVELQNVPGLSQSKVPSDSDTELAYGSPSESESEAESVTMSETEKIPGRKEDKKVPGYESIGLKNFDRLLFFLARIPCYGLKEKKWGWIAVEKLEEIHWSEKGFQGLQLDQTKKDLLENLAWGHANGKLGSFDDLVPGKGRGLVFLFSGEPGLGKTLTAESLSEKLKRPLYSVSGGELSTDVVKAEEKLKHIFKIGKRWNAFVLLDEADVLMSKRSPQDLDRNAIVAVFLRMIEYYEGVIFLTTNRAPDLDDAFYNRIHVTITYPKLNSETRAKIWSFLLETNEKTERDGTWTDAAYKVLGKLEVNGRAIKNILRTAVFLAQSKNEPLGVKHVAAVAKVNLEERNLDVQKELDAFLRDIPYP